jgi:hypothetical protein
LLLALLLALIFTSSFWVTPSVELLQGAPFFNQAPRCAALQVQAMLLRFKSREAKAG